MDPEIQKYIGCIQSNAMVWIILFPVRNTLG